MNFKSYCKKKKFELIFDKARVKNLINKQKGCVNKDSTIEKQ